MSSLSASGIHEKTRKEKVYSLSQKMSPVHLASVDTTPKTSFPAGKPVSTQAKV